MGKARRTNNHVNTNCGKICIKIPARKLMPVSNSQIVRISAGKRRLTEGSDISDDDRIRQRKDTDQG